VTAVFRALTALNLSPVDHGSRRATFTCPLCRATGAALSDGSLECSTCDGRELMASMLALADGLQDSTQRSALSAALYRAKNGMGGKPSIVLGLDLDSILDAATTAITSKDIYQRSGQLVDIVRAATSDDGIVRPEGTPRIRITPREHLRVVLGRAADWYTEDNNGNRKQVSPPMAVARDLITLGQWPGVRPLNGVVDYPLLRPDGSVVIYPGYDLQTGFIFEPTFLVDVPEMPTREQATQAAALLLERTVDFPFVDEANRSAWLAALLTPLARPAIDGPVPMTLIDANNRGVGKTMLADLIGTIVLGRALPRRSVPGDSEEWRKVMTAIGTAADPIILLDNVTSTLRSDVLDMVLTGEAFRDRLLGKNEEVVSIIKTAFMATANNAQISPDLVRRSLHIRLESRDARPELRTGFRWPRLLEDARSDRPMLLNAAMTILRGYAAAGWPDVPMAAMGSYAAWSRVVRASLVWAGLADPARTQEALRDNGDDESVSSEMLVSALRSVFGPDEFSASRVLAMAESNGDMREAVLSVADDRGRLPSVRHLGAVFKKMRGRNLNGFALMTAGKSNKGALWFIENLSQPGDERLVFRDT
jgi:hypothetical protein